MWAWWQYHSPMLGTNVETTFRQCCVNVVLTLLPKNDDWYWDNVQAVMCESCVNIAPQWRGLTLVQRSGNTLWTLYKCWCSMLYLVIIVPEWQLHNSLNFRHIYNIIKCPYIGTSTLTNMSEYYYLLQLLVWWAADEFFRNFFSESTQLCLNINCPSWSTVFECLWMLPQVFHYQIH